MACESGDQKAFVDKLNYGHNAGRSFWLQSDLAFVSSKPSGRQATITQMKDPPTSGIV